MMGGKADFPLQVVDDLLKAPEGATVLALGQDPLVTLQALKVVPKGRSITSLRNVVHEYSGRKVMLSYAPGVDEQDHSLHVDLLCDARLAARMALTGNYAPTLGKYQYVDDFGEMIAEIQAEYAKTGKPVDVCHDTETVGDDPLHLGDVDRPPARFVSWQWSHKNGVSYLRYFASKADFATAMDGVLYEQVKWLFTTPMISHRLANGKFDMRWHWFHTRRAGQVPHMECSNFRFDTTLVGSLVDENRSNGLKLHAKVYTDLGGYEDGLKAQYDKSRMDLVPKGTLLGYAGGDTDAGLQVADALKRELVKDKRLTSFYVNVLHPAARAFEVIERGGVFIDMDAFDHLSSELNKALEQTTKAAISVIGGRLFMKHRDVTKLGGINLTKASLICDYMFSPMGLNLKPLEFTEKSQQPVTGMDHLLKFKDHPEAGPFVALLKEFSSAAKMKSTYDVGFRKWIRSDGRFHPNYFLFVGDKQEDDGGAVTGRLSCKEPPFQCCVGNSLVHTKTGEVQIEALVGRYEQGEPFRVLTHTGKWRDVVGVYRNGVQPVFDVLSERGRQVTCTANHPFLTQRGWVRTDQLRPGDTCYELGPSNPEVHESNVLFVDSNEESLQQPDVKGLAKVWGAWNQGLSAVAKVRELSEGHGGKAIEGLVYREEGREWGLHPRELRMGAAEEARQQQKKHEVDRAQRSYEDRSSVGAGGRDFTREAALSSECWSDNGTSLDEGEAPDRHTFKEGRIVSITPAGYAETFDITVDGSHSFVANGVVVHNTIPKHNKWAKLIRRVFRAPVGYLVCERDYSQGELRVVACIANELEMISAYKSDLDLHVKTGGRIHHLSYEQMIALSKGSDADKAMYELYRQQAKPANFGLLYGQSWEGFQEFAEAKYGVKFSDAEAQEIRTMFFKSYPALIAYHEQYKKMAHVHLQVVSPLGRVRHLPHINSKNGALRSGSERKAINSPVQSTLADMMEWSLGIEYQTGLLNEAPCFGNVHDAAYDYVPEDKAVEYAKKKKEIMENLPFEKVGWKPQLKFPADVKLGPNMADLKKLKDFEAGSSKAA